MGEAIRESVRMHNFSAGPGELPGPVLEAAAEAVRSYGATGLPLLGLSHRSPAFDAILDEASSNLRALAGIGPDHDVLFLQGGGTLQFSMVPQHLADPAHPPQYLTCGYWSALALE